MGWMRIKAQTGPVLILLVALGLPAAMAEPEPAKRAWLGVWLSDAVDGGVEIVAVAPGGPAQRAGLLRGDVLLEVDGEPVRGEEMLGRLLRQRDPGDPVELIVLRGTASVRTRIELGRRQDAVIALPELPDPPQARWEAYTTYRRARQAHVPPFGLKVVVVTPALRAHFGAPAESGVLVTRVEPGEVAAQAGIRVGDLLVSIDETDIDDPRRLSELNLAWDRVEPLSATIVRGQEPRTVSIAARPAPAPEASAAQTWVQTLQEARAEQQKVERELLERRLSLEIERLERRIEELKRELERLRADR